MEYITKLVDSYKHLRSKKQLQSAYKGKYAFVGVGGHSMNNLYPVLSYLHVPLKYICCRSEDKVRLIEQRYENVIATTSLDDILKDNDIKGVFVSASPSAHFSLSSKILESGKSLFVEKPPCTTLQEFQELIKIRRAHGVPVAVAGMQKRYSPLTRTLKEKLRHGKVVGYNLKYLTGAYPEGDMVLDLFIHPLDLVTCLFGKAEIKCAEKVEDSNGSSTFFVVLKHRDVTGCLELSTAYSWTDAKESLTVNTMKGVYTLEQMEKLTFSPKQSVVMGIPVEKVIPRHNTVVELFSRNNFVPTFVNNQIYSQGYFDELKAFVDSVESSQPVKTCSWEELLDTYALLDAIRRGC